VEKEETPSTVPAYSHFQAVWAKFDTFHSKIIRLKRGKPLIRGKLQSLYFRWIEWNGTFAHSEIDSKSFSYYATGKIVLSLSRATV